jgi:hypothetical protein
VFLFGTSVKDKELAGSCAVINTHRSEKAMDDFLALKKIRIRDYNKAPQRPVFFPQVAHPFERIRRASDFAGIVSRQKLHNIHATRMHLILTILHSLDMLLRFPMKQEVLNHLLGPPDPSTHFPLRPFSFMRSIIGLFLCPMGKIIESGPRPMAL